MKGVCVMVRVLLRSRRGNLVIAILGAVYAVSGLSVLIAFVIDAWRAAGLVDLLFQIALLGCAGCGIWFVMMAFENLGIRPRSLFRH